MTHSTEPHYRGHKIISYDNLLRSVYRIKRLDLPGHDRQLTFHQMNRPSPHSDEDQDSLFGSPPPSPARGRSPSEETFTQDEQVGPVIAVPSTGLRRKNVGTIALPGSHMSCAELPADPPALSLSLPRTSSRDSPCTASPSVTGTPISVHTSTVGSRSTSRSVSSRASSAVSTVPSASTSASTRKQRTSKANSLTPAPSAPPITLPGPNEPTPPNFLRSQSSLLGLAGLVGSVKPSRLYTLGPEPTRGSTPTHPIVLDDDQDTSKHIGERHRSEHEMPPCLDQLNPEILRSNIMSALTKEKNIFPVLESLIKLFGAEPHLPTASPTLQPFSRPCGHGILNAQSTSPAAPISAPALKRRKLKHVPAGAVDWDIPFPFVAGEGPEGYRDTWARDRAKQLATQLLELVQNATKRAAIKTAKSRRNVSDGRTRAQSRRSSRSVSVEAQTRLSGSIREDVHGSIPHTTSGLAGIPTTPMDGPCHYPDLLESTGATGFPALDSKDGMSVNSEGTAEGSSVVLCDPSAFEEWLSQLQRLLPLEANTPTPESDWGARSPLSLNPPLPGLTSSIHASARCNGLSPSNTTQDEAINPTLITTSQLGNTLQPLDICSISTLPPTLNHSPRTSLSSLAEPLTPLSEVFAMSTMAHQDPDRDPHPVEKDGSRALLKGLFEPSNAPWAQRGEAGAGANATPCTSGQSTQGTTPASKGALDKQAILERARERRRQLVAEIERAKIELWETSIESAVLVHLTRDGSLGT